MRTAPPTSWAANANGAGSGRVHVHSGVDGRPLHVLVGEAAGDNFGVGPADAGDVDDDGHDDLVIGAWQVSSEAPSGGRVYVYSGKTGVLPGEKSQRAVAHRPGPPLCLAL